MNQTQHILKNLEPLKQKLLNHDLYKYIETPDDLRIFTQYHVFAVWDFMSLLKILQQKLTNVNVPWIPSDNAQFTYLINGIVHAEEADFNHQGKLQSHFEMYIDAMEDLGASTFQIRNFTAQIQHGTDIFLVISASDLPESVKSYLISTFNTVYHKHTHEILSTFILGREKLIPNMFSEVLELMNKKFPNENIKSLQYYFKRHNIPDKNRLMAIELLENFCHNDLNKWYSVEKSAELALQKRLELWDSVLRKILNNKAIA